MKTKAKKLCGIISSLIDSFALTPSKETIVMDTDMIVGNSNLLKCFESPA